jgi:hypothetical protein
MISQKSFDTWGFQDLHQVWNMESLESINNQLLTPQFSVEGCDCGHDPQYDVPIVSFSPKDTIGTPLRAIMLLHADIPQ